MTTRILEKCNLLINNTKTEDYEITEMGTINGKPANS